MTASQGTAFKIAYIQHMISDGIGYMIGNNVYFDMVVYTKRGDTEYDDMIMLDSSGAGKRNVKDFMLWKTTLDKRNSDSPWGYGMAMFAFDEDTDVTNERITSTHHYTH